MLTDTSAEPSRRRRHPVVAIAAFVAAVSILVGATVFAFVAASGTDGAVDAEGAVHELLDAVVRNDAIGVLEALPPDEREAFRDSLPDVASQLQRLGVLAPLSLSDVPGLHVELRGVVLQTDQLSTEVARVGVTGGQLVLTPQAGFPLPDSTRSRLEDDFHAAVDPNSGAHTIDLGDAHPSFVAVKDSGGWHTSIVYTVAEGIRGDSSGPLPRFGGGPVPVGSGTPDGAVRDLLSAAANIDPTPAVSLANPAEARGLYDYASLFLPEALRRAKAIEQDEPYSLVVKQLDLAVDDSGSMRTVRVSGADVVITDGDQRLEERYAGDCLTTTRFSDRADQTGTTVERCDGRLDPAPPPISTVPGPSRFDRLTGWQALGRAFPTFVVQERNGRWYVSPIRSVLTTVDEVLRGLQPSDVPALSDRLAWAWDLYGLPAAPDTRN